MSVPAILCLGLLGGLGAVARFLLDGALSDRLGSVFPWGTLAVNLSGAFLLGVFVGVALGDDAYRLLGTGALGSFTTFSTWMFESQRLAEEGAGRVALANVVASLALGLAAAWVGRELGMQL